MYQGTPLEVRGQLSRLSALLYRVDPETQTQVIRLDCSHIYLLSHLSTSPINLILSQCGRFRDDWQRALRVIAHNPEKFLVFIKLVCNSCQISKSPHFVLSYWLSLDSCAPTEAIKLTGVLMLPSCILGVNDEVRTEGPQTGTLGNIRHKFRLKRKRP